MTQIEGTTLAHMNGACGFTRAHSLEDHYQHVKPQRNYTHSITPKIYLAGMESRICSTCGAPIKRVDEDEGPEGLKALLSF